jgi:hypothetical protein
MRKPAIITLTSLSLLGLAGSAAWACDWDDGYRQSRVYRYSYAPRAYGYYAPTYGYRAAYLDDDDYDYGYGYGYGGVAVGVDVGRDRRFHRRHFARTAVNVGERSGRVREGTLRASSGREGGAAFRGAGSGEGGRAAGSGMSSGMGAGTSGRGGDTGGRR